MIRSHTILRTVIKRNNSQRAAPSIVAARRRTDHHYLSIVQSTTVASSERALSTAHRHDHDDDDGPPPKKNTFGGDFNWKDPLCIANSLTDDEVRRRYPNSSLHFMYRLLILLTYAYHIIIICQTNIVGYPRSSKYILPK